MLEVDLSTLRGPELRRLLDATREHGQAAQSYQILQEMAARRERRARGGARALLPGRRPAEPRVIEVDFGDPMERRDEPPPLASWGPPPPESEAAASSQPKTEPAARRSRWPGAGFAAGVTVGVAVGWWAGTAREPLRAPAPAAVAALPAVALQSSPAPTPVAPIAAEPDPALQEAAAEPAAALPETSPPSPDTPNVAQDATVTLTAPAQPAAEPAEAAATPASQVARLAPGVAKDCAAEPTAADRAICADPRLQHLQRRLRQAYAEALAAHEDRALLRERQLAWRTARNTISEPDRLAQVYEQRIRKLNAATAAARRQ